MGIWHRCAAIFAALFLPVVAAAQDVTLASRDGALVLDGTLMTYDGEFYRVETRYGLLTMDAQGVVCTGPGCPDLTAPVTTVRIMGEAGAGRALLPGVIGAFAASRGFDVAEVPASPEQDAGGFRLDVTAPQDGGRLIARFGFTPTPPDEARAALATARADLVLSPQSLPDLAERVLGLDAMVPVVSADNPLPAISTADLARVLTGEVMNWAEIGGEDRPLVLYALPQNHALQQALEGRLGRVIKARERRDDPAILAQAVAQDPYAIALTGRAVAGQARLLPLTDSCGFPLPSDLHAIKAEDYPLALPIRLVSPRRRLPLLTREFLDFLALPEAQAAIAEAGYADRAPERRPLAADGLRLLNALRQGGAEVTLEALQQMARQMDGADRLSFTFRFRDGSSTLDGPSRDSLERFAALIEAGAFAGQALHLVGFSDGSGAAAANLTLSQERAETVLARLTDLVQDLPEGQEMPEVLAFGEVSPIACDETEGGRRINRRVEVWIRPAPR